MPAEPLRVLYLDTAPRWGGGQASLAHLLAALDRERVLPLLASPPGSPLAQRARELGVETFALPLASRSAPFGGSPGGAPRGPAFARALALLPRWSRACRADLHHANNTLAGLLAAAARPLAGAPFVFHHRVEDGRAARFVAARAAATICVSRAALRGLGAAARRASVVYDGIALDEFAEVAPLAPDAPPVVAVVGRLSREKGQDLALDAMPALLAAIPGAKLLLAGSAFLPEDAGFEAQLRRRAAEPPLRGRVEFLGHVTAGAELYRRASVVLVPSRREGLGLAAIEAMASGRPVVACAVGGLPESVVDGETGFLVPPGDAAALAAAAARLLGDPALARRQAARGRDRAGEFSRERMAREVAELYRTLRPALDRSAHRR